MKAEQTQKIEHIKRYIRNVLRKVGAYDESLGYQIEVVATDLLIYRKLREQILAEDFSMTFNEQSREGDARIKLNPLFSTYQEQSKRVTDGFDKLTMNVKAKKKKVEAKDTFADFMSAMRDDEE